LADRLLRREAIQSRRSPVPRENRAREILADDCVFGGFNDGG